jgi:hypothetical protein
MLTAFVGGHDLAESVVEHVHHAGTRDGDKITFAID